MSSYTDIFAPNPLRATENEVYLQFIMNPIDFIKTPKQQQQEESNNNNNNQQGGFVLEGAEEVEVSNNNNEEGGDNEDVNSENGGGAPISDDGTQPDTPVGNSIRKSFRHPKDEDYEQEDNNENQQQQQLTCAIAPTFDSFLQLISQHPAVSNLIIASSQKQKGTTATLLSIKRDDIRYAVEPLAPSATSGYSNRFDQRLYDNFIALIKAREDAEKSREEHDKIMATRPPPTPPPEEEHQQDEDGYQQREIQYDEDGNEIEVDEDEDENQNQNNQQQESSSAPPPRPRKNRAQRREEEKQRKEDKKREFEVEQKEHLVACLEQKLANAVCAAAIRVVIAP